MALRYFGGKRFKSTAHVIIIININDFTTNLELPTCSTRASLHRDQLILGCSKLHSTMHSQPEIPS